MRVKSETKDSAVKNHFGGSIRGNIIFYVALCTVIIIMVTATINSIMMRNVLVSNGCNTLTEQAANTGELIDGWLVRQAYIVNTMKSALETMDTGDMDSVMDYLETNLDKNPDALMYYCCLAYDGGVFRRIILPLILIRRQEAGGRMPLKREI